ncbi:LOW QUALITY PROTEIN: Hypothetical protein PHPALM_6247 [Phytophthora palmivora]|uniref:Uncharacterized protein n=1 Tax=Phytophthora palmivora TaxID=4796 RepID=A0A2P4YFC9_9STRA|nr:LOW QUALITY PROTEIN: Hypothetical protein PHPALM_6247 [Phytophthora palmivora]
MSQVAFGRGMIADIAHKTYWTERSLGTTSASMLSAATGNTRPVTACCSRMTRPKMAPLYSEPYEAIAERVSRMLLLDNGGYIETVHIRRVVPVKSQRDEDCQQDQDL